MRSHQITTTDGLREALGLERAQDADGARTFASLACNELSYVLDRIQVAGDTTESSYSRQLAAESAIKFMQMAIKTVRYSQRASKRAVAREDRNRRRRHA